ncbi:ATP-binding cassette domain-containing protein [uncultured Alistipes sp.]|uniref:ABC-F family ATP-binding cassette domain-containing protein n=1 Tax=uncultured Alistipes sp. TaxID=538949 RepID=UPI0026251610|nr:ATP-binding cassette domain-containing protein [uncultured Alistipes sp.]
MSIIVSGISYRYTNQQTLFDGLCLTVAAGAKVSVVGDNGSGKSTLLKVIAGHLSPVSGSIACASRPYYVPQQVGITGISVGRALGVAAKLEALHAICGGSSEPAYFDALADDWDIESRCRTALDHWGLPHITPDAPIDTLSGGEKTRLFLAGLAIHDPAVVLLDEPTNHLDTAGREKLYDYVRTSRAAMVVVSHDVTLLNLLGTTCELTAGGLEVYGGNFDFYRGQKAAAEALLERRIDSEQAALRLARKRAQEVRERQEKRMREGEKHKAGLPRIMRKTLKDSGERALCKLRDKQAELLGGNRERLAGLRQQRGRVCELKIDFDDAQLHEGKTLVTASGVNFCYPGGRLLWPSSLDLEIRSGERVRLTGGNGTGKTTLVRLLTGQLEPTAGRIGRAGFSYVWLDQEYRMADTPKSVLELAQASNRPNWPDHELKLRLHRALFPREMWDKRCDTLSGGERMRLCLCCLMISDHVPDMFILDEPTNNLDLSSLAILTRTIGGYRGTLLVISHDRHFVGEIGITRTFGLDAWE